MRKTVPTYQVPFCKSNFPALLKSLLTASFVAFFLMQTLSGQKTATKPTATGTGNTTGHIANLSVTNSGPDPLKINAQTAYIPSDGHYQPYVARISETIVPPNTTSSIPMDGFCADVHTPPVPSMENMPPVGTWIPVGPDDHLIPEGTVNIIPGPTRPPFTPGDIPKLTGNPGFNATPEGTVGEVISTWPGTDVPVGGVIDPKLYPEIFAPVIVTILTHIEDATVDILDNDGLGTPFANNPEKELESVIQQTFWMIMADITGEEYRKDDFAERVYDQFQSTTGTPVAKLPEEQKERVDGGVDDFWNTFQAVGVEAKVISTKSPGLGLDLDEQAETTNALITVEDKCECGDFTYDLEVTRAGVVVYSSNDTTPTHPIVRIPGFRLGDALSVKISNIQIQCKCEEILCLSYPAEDSKPNSTGSTKTDTAKRGKENIHMENDGDKTIGTYGNNNCKNVNGAWNEEETEYTFTLETKDEKSLNNSVFQRVMLKAYCEVDDCARGLCKEIVQINIVAP